MRFGGYLNHVRQALNALPRSKHVIYYNAMQGTTQTQAHFLVKLLKSSTLSSFLNLQTGLLASFTALSLSHKSGTFFRTTSGV